ncbi:alpha/beta fold hydrolase [Yoonia sediminilitoris]|uniref:Pimeloyl-ACP methyl ester carboxylesterase n=1 Tax=Yoonia sediminilitoris TaxID=1286148 RepID=A0A2T6KAH6_9RHOB|nr:alpha/beta hydrolase [Yoonia sediminilitoris]PUB11804.1 pimeloyl-ACP methyl ester carboxylesterase [Yoonia sediminilitoris]RCW91881.1 pimeloyl-ACP methyl ester carboxylesterase [Yoonia sediminilitoris]
MTPLVLVHGFMGGSAQWDLQLADLGAHREVIAIDLPGFGKNNHMPANASIEGYAKWVIGELRSKGFGKYDLLGHSMGGMIVQEMVRHDPDQINRLVLYSTGPVGVLPGRFETIAQSKARAKLDGAKATARRIAATWFLDREQGEDYAGCAAIAERATTEAIAAGLDAMEGWSGTDHLGDIKQQSLVIWGDKDRTYPWSQTELLWRGIPHTNLAVVPGCAHAVHLEKPAIFNSLLIDWLEG